MALLFALFSFRDSGPLHEGKPVRQWIAEWIELRETTMSSDDERLDPILAIGANAVVPLVEAIKQHRGIRSREWYRSTYPKLPSALSRHLPAPGNNVAIRAYWTLVNLGPDAQAAVPFVATQLDTNNTLIDFAAHTLAALGTNARAALPVLTNAFHDSNPVRRRYAARILACVEPSYPELLPKMIKDLTSTNIIDRRCACLVFDYMGPQAKPARAAVEQALTDSDSWVRQHATNALKQIDLASDRVRWGFSRPRRRGEQD
jgi:hypothetical protein